MKTIYKHWMWGHVIVLAIYLSWYAILLFIGHESKYPLDIYLVLQAILSIVLWELISKRLFIPAFYLACSVVMAATYNIYTISINQNISLISTTANEIYHCILYFCIALFSFFLYGILAYYPYRVMKTAKKLRLV